MTADQVVFKDRWSLSTGGHKDRFFTGMQHLAGITFSICMTTTFFLKGVLCRKVLSQYSYLSVYKYSETGLHMEAWRLRMQSQTDLKGTSSDKEKDCTGEGSANEDVQS